MSDNANDLLDDEDFTEFATTPEVGDLKRLTDMVKRAAEIQEGLDKIELRKKKGNELLRQLLEEEIPQAMQECGFGIDDSITAGGFTVVVKKEAYANVPAVSSIEKERDPDRREELEARRTLA